MLYKILHKTNKTVKIVYHNMKVNRNGKNLITMLYYKLTVEQKKGKVVLQ